MKTMNIRVICDNLSHIQKYKKYFIYVKMMLFENSINKFDIVSKFDSIYRKLSQMFLISHFQQDYDDMIWVILITR